MNTIYRIVWNAATGKWVVASELAKGRKKKSTRSMASLIALTAAVAGVGFTGYASAQTLGNNVTQGNAGNVVLGDNAAGASACTADPSLPAGAYGCSVVIGNTASAATGNTVVIGDHASTTANASVAIGAYSTAGKYSQAIGAGAQATGGWATAIGQSAQATSTNATAIGTNSTATGDAATAIGGGAHASADKSFAMGWSSNATGTGSMAFGYQVTAAGENAIAMGLSSQANADNAVALGSGAHANTTNSVALGTNSDVGTRTGVVSVGAVGSERQIINVAAGTADTDAVNVSQMKASGLIDGSGNAVAAVTYDQNADGSPNYNSVTMGNGQSTGPVAIHNVAAGTLSATSTDAVNGSQLYTTNQQVGQNTSDITNLGNRVTINEGDITTLQGQMADAVMYDDSSHGSVTLGGATATAPVALHNVAAGELSSTSTDAVNGSQLYATNQQVSQNTTDITNVQNSVAASTRYFQANGKNDGTDDASATGQNAVAVGASALASATQATALGANTVATQANATAIGAGAQAPAQNSTAIGANSVAAVVGATAIGNSAQATAQNATAIGPNSVANVANTISVGSASNQRRITNVAAGTGDTDAVNVAQLKSSGLINNDGNAVAAVTYDENADGTPNYGSVTMGGPVSTDGGLTGGTKITNVAQGSLSATSTDAVNGSQLYATNQQVSQNTTDITNLQNGVAASTRYFQANGKNDGTDDASAGGQNSVAVGASASASAERSVAVGQGATASLSEGRVAGANIPGYAGTPITNTAIGANTQASTGGTALGDSAQATGLASAAVGAYANSTGDFGTAVGFGAQATGSSSTALGVNAQATANNSVALGVSSVADRANTVSVGSAGKERQITNVAAGTEDTDAVNVAQLKSAGLVDDNGNTMDAVVYDPGTNRGQVTLGGMGAAAPVVLTNVANGVNQYDAVNFGQLSGLQTDLQNQINTVNGQVTNIDNRVTTLENDGGSGGGTPDYVAANASAQPSAAANVGDTTGVALGYNTAATGDNASAVGDSAQATGDNSTAVGSNAVASNTGGTALGSSASVNASNGVAVGNNATVASSASNGTAVGSGSSVNAASGTAVGQGASVASNATNSVALGAGSVATQANSVSVGSAGNERTITNVAAGVNATDAVNVSQLQSSQNWAQSYVDQKASQLNSRITSVGRHADAGTAGAIAMTNIPQAYQPNQSSVGAGVGAFNGQAAIAVGMSTITPGGRWVLKGSLTGTTQGDVGVGFGASMVW
ncbi:hypothetical protein EKH79_02815 [Dyella dinghuensis]|uniref:Adhesin n=1 Tax=Dyella dinghuensis TaxID=1920169 RepID=A0A432LXF1_9GAMM|nr:ESPR-type extended signal peptide-containing protein [Dyella dinghuensis]RUL66761.1 hypothetical protein EKH79_02815 [Dyella dinghuensis]